MVIHGSAERLEYRSGPGEGTLTTALGHATRRGGLAVRMLFIAYTGAAGLFALLATVAGLAGAWWASYAAGGSHTAAPHLFYVPIILAAVRFAWPVVLATAVTAGVLAGPALPAEVSSGVQQRPEDWLLRLLMFVLIGAVLALLIRGRPEPLRSTMQDSLTSVRLIHAVQRGQIDVHYQPLYRLEDQHIVSFEALARWEDPRRGRLSPDEFIPPAERTGAIDELDRYVLRVAAAQMQGWCADLGRPLRLSVNVSATRFKGGDLVFDLARALDQSGLPAQALEIEITESALIDNIGDAVEQIHQLRSLGVRIAIDDFGAGHASLGHLTDFEVDTIKLDRSFLRRATTDTRARDVLAGVAQLLNDLDVETVAEGVETEDQVVLLRELGVRIGQGFYLGRPLPALATERLLRFAVSPSS